MYVKFDDLTEALRAFIAAQSTASKDAIDAKIEELTDQLNSAEAAMKAASQARKAFLDSLSSDDVHMPSGDLNVILHSSEASIDYDGTLHIKVKLTESAVAEWKRLNDVRLECARRCGELSAEVFGIEKSRRPVQFSVAEAEAYLATITERPKATVNVPKKVYRPLMQVGFLSDYKDSF